MEKQSFLGKGWWNGVGVIISVITFFMVWWQTERLHSETKRMNEQMDKQAEIQRMKDNVEKYLQYEWFDKAIEENKELNKALEPYNRRDSTCYYYLLHEYDMQLRMGKKDVAEITSKYLNQSKH